MTITHILVFAGASLPFMWLVPARGRPWGLLAASVLAVGWLQSGTTGGAAAFVLPAAVVVLTVAAWWIVQPESALLAPARRREMALSLAVTVGALAVVWIALWIDGRPGVMNVLPGAGLTCVAAFSGAHLLPVTARSEQQATQRRIAVLAFVGITLVLVLLKSATLARWVGLWLSGHASDHPVAPFAWLGFSYIAFRLFSLLLDFRSSQLPPDGLSLRDMLVYVLFFPAYTAGPIDRAPRFAPELAQARPLDASRLVEGGGRIAAGIVKKFVIADSLALIALNPTLIDQTTGAPGLWLLLYLYAFQIFFDFSGYSDVAIGLGRLYGITLPENFDRPYAQSNIQQFWQHWHITLSTWFRLYYFTPISRALIKRRVSPTRIVLFTQVSTMLLIGLWHGVTANFVLWGLWHGIGLFVNKLQTDRTRVWYLRVSQRPWPRRLIYAGGVLLTFHFVTLGWVFFALPTPGDSIHLLGRLFGLGG